MRRRVLDAARAVRDDLHDLIYNRRLRVEDWAMLWVLKEKVTPETVYFLKSLIKR